MRLLKIVGWILGVLVVLVAGLLAFAELSSPAHREVTNRKFEVTPQRLEQGKYLAEGDPGLLRLPLRARLGHARRPAAAGWAWRGVELPVPGEPHAGEGVRPQPDAGCGDGQ